MRRGWDVSFLFTCTEKGFCKCGAEQPDPVSDGSAQLLMVGWRRYMKPLSACHGGVVSAVPPPSPTARAII